MWVLLKVFSEKFRSYPTKFFAHSPLEIQIRDAPAVSTSTAHAALTHPQRSNKAPATVVGTIPTAQNQARCWRVIWHQQEADSISEEFPSDTLQIGQRLCGLPDTNGCREFGQEDELAVIQMQ